MLNYDVHQKIQKAVEEELIPDWALPKIVQFASEVARILFECSKDAFTDGGFVGVIPMTMSLNMQVKADRVVNDSGEVLSFTWVDVGTLKLVEGIRGLQYEPPVTSGPNNRYSG